MRITPLPLPHISLSRRRTITPLDKVMQTLGCRILVPVLDERQCGEVEPCEASQRLFSNRDSKNMDRNTLNTAGKVSTGSTGSTG